MDIGTVWAMVQTTVAQAPEKTADAVAAGISGADLRIAAKCIGAGLAMGIGALGSGLSEGIAAAKACEGVARNPEAKGAIQMIMIIGQAVTESVAIYALVVACLILFVIK